MDPVDPQVDVVHLGQAPVGEQSGLVLPLRGQPGDRRRGQPGPGAEELLQRRPEVQTGQPVQIQQRQHLGDLRRFARPRRQDRRGEPLPLTGFRIDPLVVHPRRGHRHRTGPGHHLPLLVVAVADHQPVTVLVADVGERVDVGGDLRLQRRRQHLAGTVPDDLIQQRTTDRPATFRILRCNYREHGRTFPTGVGAPALLEGYLGLSGRYVLPADPQVSSIALEATITPISIQRPGALCLAFGVDDQLDSVAGRSVVQSGYDNICTQLYASRDSMRTASQLCE